MTAQVVFGFTSELVECSTNECGNTTHSSIGVCGECLNEQSFIATRQVKVNASARRFLINGH